MLELGLGGPISMRLTPGAQPDSSSEDIQLAMLLKPPGGGPPKRGQEWPTWGLPSVTLLPVPPVQSRQVDLGP